MSDSILIRLIGRTRYLNLKLWIDDHAILLVFVLAFVIPIIAYVFFAARTEQFAHERYTSAEVQHVLDAGHDDDGSFSLTANIVLADGQAVVATTSDFALSMTIIDTVCVEVLSRSYGSKRYRFAHPRYCKDNSR